MNITISKKPKFLDLELVRKIKHFKNNKDMNLEEMVCERDQNQNQGDGNNFQKSKS